MTSLKEFMNEQKLINRWTVLKIALAGGIAGACLMFMVALLGLIGPM